MTGRIHSFESLGAVDGPGLRFVVFMQGCPLRCAYCHNPDTWDARDGEEWDADSVMQKILRYEPYFGENGGVTVSGGEALLQSEFVSELFSKCRAMGIHTALDTSGIGDIGLSEAVLLHTDLAICDIKFTSDGQYRQYCGGSLSEVEKFLSRTESLGIPLWVRHVVIPGLTDTEDNITKLWQIANKYSNLQRVELLPFRKLCVQKYEKMGIDFPFADRNECSAQTLGALKAHLATLG